MNPLREKILTTGTRARPSRKVTLDLGGEDGAVTIELRQPNKALKGEIYLAVGVKEGRPLPLNRLAAEFIARCAYDDKGKRIFKDRDAGEIAKLGEAVDPVFDAVVELMGATKQAVDAGNESGPTATS